MATTNNLEILDLHKGDDSNFFYAITLNIDTDLDLLGWTGYFQVDGISPIQVEGVEDKQIPIVVKSSITRSLGIGKHVAYLKLITNTGLVGTLKPLFIINVLPEVVNI